VLASEAKAVADETNAPKPAKALAKVLATIEAAAKKGKYQEWISLRHRDAILILEDLEKAGYLAKLLPPDREEDVLLSVSWQ
jgi:hypothetical protein